MEARHVVDLRDDAEEINELVARIRARGSLPLPTPDGEGVARFLAHTLDELPMSDDDLDEHERIWQAVDNEVRALDQPTSGTARLV